ncbi:hypothetical protein HOLleu_38321 [Holothuria leucospilota]|uniref:Uncharacterized protein n=1 Tax=Holothuria leucospilota TaxID=206669 RepID=A0A9Q0YII6_HOLLE|nr:hypothetical protein HOLleu_38321 [Holothuria leucospilota]
MDKHLTMENQVNSICNRLQRIQNTAARIVSRVGKHTSVTRLCKDLHWLPIRARIEYKILILVFRAINSGTPSYLSGIVKHQSRNRPVRSHHLHQLQTPASNTKAYGDRCFFYAAPRLWNALPPSLRCIDQLELFKHHLKTFLFSSCY